MASSGVRKVIAVGGVAALAVVLAACSGGSSRVTAGPGSTRAPQRTTSTTARSSVNKRVTTTTRKPVSSKVQPKAPARSSSTGSTVASAGVGVNGSTQPAGTSSLPASVNSSEEFVIGAPDTSPQTSTPTTVPGPKPYDPSKPIDLGGEPGVTPAEQARAEQLVRDTLRDLPKYANPTTAYADGYRSINDGVTGTEHYVKWSYVDDGHILDSKYPESLVYQMRNGVKTLVSAMYMLPLGSRFTDVPDVGGALTQWHIHNNLCLVDNPSDPLQKVVGGLTGSDGSCPPGTTKAASTPMLHVWIVANPCGPFAPLDGIEAGQVPDGQTPLCDTGHGSQ